MTDSHAHLSLCAEGGLGLASFFVSWREAGGGTIVDIGIKPGDALQRAALLRGQGGGDIPSFVRFAAGAWPYEELLLDPLKTAHELEASMVADGAPAIAAIGECGLDYHHMNAPRVRQMELFAACAGLARRKSLPLIVHSRDAFADTLAVVKESGWAERTIIHCFSYGPEEARAFLDAGARLSFSGSVTFKSAESIRQAAALAPIDRILVETDAPYMTPGKARGKRPSTPLDVAVVAAFIAELRGVSFECLTAETDKNAAGLFG